MATNRGTATVPIVRRARGYRLYDRQGRRYLDLHRDGGGALLGHRTGTTITIMKSVLSQGLVSALPSVWESRLIRMIASLLPAHPIVRLYSSRGRALEAASRFLGMRVDPLDLHDPAIHEGPLLGGPRAFLWRPFLPDLDPEAVACAPVLPVLPLTVCEAPAAVCFPDDQRGEVPVSDQLPGFILAGAVAALARLRSVSGKDHFAVHEVIHKALDRCPGWARIGPYVRATFSPAEYPGVSAEFLRSGVLLSPWYPGPSILPGECSPGEAKLLADLFSRIPGG